MLWYSLEDCDAFNDYPQHTFLWRNKKKYNFLITLLSGAMYYTHTLKQDGYENVCNVYPNLLASTVEPRYLELAYFELPLISKRKSGPCFNMKL